MSDPDKPSANMPDTFDRMLGNFDGLPDVLTTRQSTIRFTPPLGVGGSILYVVQTVRQQHDDGPARDHIFLEAYPGARLVLPPEVANLIARQRDSLSTMARKKGAKKATITRAERGIVPGFLKNRGKRGKK